MYSRASIFKWIEFFYKASFSSAIFEVVTSKSFNFRGHRNDEIVDITVFQVPTPPICNTELKYLDKKYITWNWASTNS